MKCKIQIREGEQVVFATFKLLINKAHYEIFKNHVLEYTSKKEALQVLQKAKEQLNSVRIKTRFNKNLGVLQNVKTGAQATIETI